MTTPILDAARKVREAGDCAIRIISGGHRSEAALQDLLAYTQQLRNANASFVLGHIESICEKCGHIKTEDGCAFCMRSVRPTIITICGSSRFVGESAVKAWELNKQGIATFYMPLLPQWYPGVQEHHQAETEGVAENLDNLWLRLIEMSDEIFVINCGGYIGQRTRIEIDHALKVGKPVRYLEPLNYD